MRRFAKSLLLIPIFVIVTAACSSNAQQLDTTPLAMSEETSATSAASKAASEAMDGDIQAHATLTETSHPTGLEADANDGANTLRADAARDIPRLAISSSAPNVAKSAIVVNGTLENTNEPSRFRLRTSNGCVHDAQIDAVTTGSHFALSLREAELADAFACVVDAEIGAVSKTDAVADVLTLASVAVTPDADVITANATLSVETFSVASIDLEPPPNGASEREGGQIIRIAILSTTPNPNPNPNLNPNANPSASLAERATMNVLGTTIVGLASAATDDDVQSTRITFEVPSRMWARAAIAGASVSVVVSTGTTRQVLELRPTARVELLGDDDDVEPDC